MRSPMRRKLTGAQSPDRSGHQGGRKKQHTAVYNRRGPVREARFKRGRRATPTRRTRSCSSLAAGRTRTAAISRTRFRRGHGGRQSWPAHSDTSFRQRLNRKPLTTKRFSLTGLPIAGKNRRSASRDMRTEAGNDGTVTRFGWKAQKQSLFVFSAEAYNVEQGVSNDVFPQERESAHECRYNATPEDHMDMNAHQPGQRRCPLHDVHALLAPPARGTRTIPATTATTETVSGNNGNSGDNGNSSGNGETLFTSIGCAFCHTPALTTSSNQTAALSNQRRICFPICCSSMGQRSRRWHRAGPGGGR